MEKFKTNKPKCTTGIAKLCAALAGALFVSNMALAAEDCGASQSSARGAQPFLIFDGTLYTKKPDLSKHGIKPIMIIDRGIWSANGSRDSVPDPTLIKGILQKIENSKTPVVLDFESFPLTGSDEVVGNSLSKMTSIIAAFKLAASDRMFGFYATLPIRDYWRAVEGPGNQKYMQWQQDNEKLRALEKKVDVLFPSLYTFYDDKAGWIKYATAQICEARRLSKKPVYVFLWPDYHDSNGKLGGTPIDPEFWRIQLETVRMLSDGVVIWGGFDYAKKRPADWDENAGWWQKTKEFAQQIK